MQGRFLLSLRNLFYVRSAWGRSGDRPLCLWGPERGDQGFFRVPAFSQLSSWVF